MADDYARDMQAARQKVIARMKKEEASIQELCGGIGHRSATMAGWGIARDYCAVCDSWLGEQYECAPERREC